MTVQMVLGSATALALVAGAAAQFSATGSPTGPKTADMAAAAAAPKPVPTILGIPAPALATPVAATPIATAPAALRPLDLSTMRLWNWGAKWIGSEWGNAMSPLPWKYSQISQPAAADTLLTLSAKGSAQLQGGGATAAMRDGLWETDVTLPRLKEGLVVAPLWLYDPASRDEIDFELAGRKGLDVTMHVYVGGVHKTSTKRLFAETDMSLQRKRFGVRVDQTLGAVEMFVDGKRVHIFERSKMGFFVSKPVKPWIELWAADPRNANFVAWVGKWPGLATGEALTMRVHGYGYTTLAGQRVN